MPESQEHATVRQLAKGRGAMLISQEALQNAALRSLETALAFGIEAQVEIATGHDAIVGRFRSSTVDVSSMKAALQVTGNSFSIELSPGFSLEIELIEPSSKLAYSIIEIDVPASTFPISAMKNVLSFEAPSQQYSARVKEAATRSEAIAESGVGERELLRVEGSIAYGSGSRLVNATLGTLPSVNLDKMFPAFEFSGLLELHEVSGSLLVIPEMFKFLGNTGCPKGDATDGMIIVPQTPDQNGNMATWPVLVEVPDPKIRRRTIHEPGLVSAYLPQDLLNVQFGKTAPAVTYRDHDGGFIGYDVELSAAIRGVQVTIDPIELALRLKLDFASWGLAVATIDVPCVGRMDLAQVRFEMPENNGTGSIEALVRLTIDPSGRLLFVTELGAVNLGKAMVSVQLFSKYLGMAGGKAAVIGFIVDAVIGRVIAHNLPGLIFDAISDAVNQHFFVLADLSDWRSSMRRMPNHPTWSDNADSVLLGLAWNG